MYLQLWFLLACYSLLPITSAGKLSCGNACQEALSHLKFSGTDPTASYYSSQCQNEIHVQSFYICMRENCTPRGRSLQTLINLDCYLEDALLKPSHSTKSLYLPASNASCRPQRRARGLQPNL